MKIQHYTFALRVRLYVVIAAADLDGENDAMVTRGEHGMSDPDRHRSFTRFVGRVSAVLSEGSPRLNRKGPPRGDSKAGRAPGDFISPRLGLPHI
jgi:hypothetical protein